MAIRDEVRTFRQAAWLGWQMEANWTQPFIFAIYTIIKPIAGTLILVFMYLVIFPSALSNPVFFAYMYIGNAFYMYVAQVLFGIVMVIHEDREHYMTLKQVYIAPISFHTYIVGRAASKVALTTIAIVITLAFGVFTLNLQIDLASVDWLLLALSIITGLICICMIGVALAGVSFLTAKHGMGINEGVAGMFYLFCGVVFPLTALPSWGQAIGQAIPLTYWLEITRRALVPNLDMASISGLGEYSSPEILVLLLVSSLIFLVISIGIFRYADYVARKKGKLDMTTTY
ncbi:MAG TPA: ABC transporter permease [Methanomassiliicoccales archaeon]|nr:ABC transporter permease [Methanomassiliicoccales archaeon]